MSLDSQVKNGKRYWRIVESRRVNGKPRPIPVLNLGTAEALVERLLKSAAGPFELESFEHGPVAALKAIADELGLAQLIDKHVPESRHGLSVGTTLLMIILGRAVCPTSKRAWHDWARTTSLERLVPGLRAKELTSQYFWDQMDLVDANALERIEDEVTRRLVAHEELSLDTLLYDTTNWFTYIATTNTRPKLPARGKNKQRRNDLRQVGLALLVSRDAHVPLMSRVYGGNAGDAPLFSENLTRIRERVEGLVGSLQDVTLVYDRGNNSKANQAQVDASDVGYVAALTPSQQKDLIAIPLAQYDAIPQEEDEALAGMRAYRLTKKVWGAKRTLVLYESTRLKDGQTRGLAQHLGKALTALAEWKQQLAKPRSGAKSMASAQKRLDGILKAQHVKKVLSATYDAKKKGQARLSWSLDEEARRHLEAEVFGKRILMTNRHHWTTPQIIKAYHGQAAVDEAFRSCKDEDHVGLRPQYHWTDQKIRVHVFTCLAALILLRVLERRAAKAKRPATAPVLLRDLGRVRVAMVLEPPGPKGGRPRARWQLERCPQDTLAFYRSLVPEKTEFVYTLRDA